MRWLPTKEGSAVVNKRSPCIARKTIARPDPIPPFYIVATPKVPDSCLGRILGNVAKLLSVPHNFGASEPPDGPPRESA